MTFDSKFVGESLKYKLLDYDDIAMDIARKHKDGMGGYDIRLFETYKDKAVGYPFFRIVDLGSGAELKILLVGGPLYNDQFENLLRLKNDGFMVMGI